MNDHRLLLSRAGGDRTRLTGRRALKTRRRRPLLQWTPSLISGLGRGVLLGERIFPEVENAVAARTDLEGLATLNFDVLLRGKSHEAAFAVGVLGGDDRQTRAAASDEVVFVDDPLGDLSAGFLLAVLVTVDLGVEARELACRIGLVAGDAFAELDDLVFLLRDRALGRLDDLEQVKELFLELLMALLEPFDLLLDGVVLLGRTDLAKALLTRGELLFGLLQIVFLLALQGPNFVEFALLLVEIVDEFFEKTRVFLQTGEDFRFLLRDFVKLQIDVLEFPK
jgi:hypothetical protein